VSKLGLAALGCAAQFALACAPAVGAAAQTANDAHAFATTASRRLDHICTSRYHTVQTREELARVDDQCLPAARAYEALREAHRELANALRRSGAGIATNAQVIARLEANVRDRRAELHAILEHMSRSKP
jgi:hypothetical protein